LLGGAVAAHYLAQSDPAAHRQLADTGLDYFKFIAVVGSLYAICGGILLDITGTGNARINTLLLGSSLLFSNVLGTTGASLLLIRPYLRLNRERLRPFHIVFFIFIVSNASGILTPIGPPLFLGYLNGVPFDWPLRHCWPAALFMNGALLSVFALLDARVPSVKSGPRKVYFRGRRNLLFLGLALVGIFGETTLNPLLPDLKHWPLGALLMTAAGAAAYLCADRKTLAANEFNFTALTEVAILFAGIFVTMMPALEFVSAHAAAWDLRSPGQFYWATGTTSAVLDNAPAYLNSLSAALGLHGLRLNPGDVARFAAENERHLLGISLGAVVFGGCTYIGNGPNLMVKAIAEAADAPVPSFFGYIVCYTAPILLPTLLAAGWLFLN
jgi:Na+/H+ antiporter NhaD/arsenite permease-like protein